MRAEARGGLERFCSAGKGRGLRALRPFHVGDLLFSCPAYACVLTVGERGHHCECCFARYAAATVRGSCGREGPPGATCATLRTATVCPPPHACLL